MQSLCDDGFTVLIETSGAHDISPIDPRVRRIMDLKCPSSGEAGRNLPSNLAHLQPSDEVKFVIGTVEDYAWAKAQIVTHQLDTRCPVLFSWVHPLAPRTAKPSPQTRAGRPDAHFPPRTRGKNYCRRPPRALPDPAAQNHLAPRNEILRGLVAKYNLAPYQNADGTYPFPSSTNPFAYPQFPFSNPPYAARAYAYVSAAQYDALVTAWHFKKLYNRTAPYSNDPGVQALIPKSTLPSYPSEDAVVAGATVEIVKITVPDRD